MTVKQLNTPTKRMSALGLVAGLLLVVLGFGQFLKSSLPLDNALYAFQRGPLWALRYSGEFDAAVGALLLWLGLSAAVAGLLGSYLYDQTVGKIVHWARTGALPQPAPRHPSQPVKQRSPIVLWVGDIFLSLLQNWVTALFGLGMGVIYLQTKKEEFLLFPAGIVLFFWLQAAIRSAIAGERGQAPALALLLGAKFVIAYIFFAIGVLSAAIGFIR